MLPRAGRLARVLAGTEGPRYRIEACDGHRPAPDEGRALTAAGFRQTPRGLRLRG
jgi:hypothetical protein